MRRMLSLAFLVVSVPLVAQIRFIPPNVDIHTAPTVLWDGVWGDACVPADAGVTQNGSTITFLFDDRLPGVDGCAQVLTAYRRVAYLNPLPAGAYDFVVDVIEADGNRFELARKPFVVRDFYTLSLSRDVFPMSGGSVTISWPATLGTASAVSIGGVSATFTNVQLSVLTAGAAVTVPPHAAGFADVAVTLPGGTRTAKQEIYYDDPTQPADRAVWEPVLFPLAYEGAGAFGSAWMTTNTIASRHFASRFRATLPCSGCSDRLSTNVVSPPATLDKISRRDGIVLYVERTDSAFLDISSSIRETSHNAQPGGLEVPAVREADFAPDSFLLNVPVIPNSRATLRVWAWDDAGTVSVRPTEGFGGRELVLSRDTPLQFGQLDVSDLVAGGQPGSTVPLTIGGQFGRPHLWGMVSITTNDTQQVTIVSKQ